MLDRIKIMLACLVGSVIAALVGLVMLLTFNAFVLPMLSAALFPAIACWKTGKIEFNQIAKIAGYAALGWLLGSMLQPMIVESPAQHSQRILAMPLVGRDWHIPASALSTLLALVGVSFAPLQTESVKKKHIDDIPE